MQLLEQIAKGSLLLQFYYKKVYKLASQRMRKGNGIVSTQHDIKPSSKLIIPQYRITIHFAGTT